MYHSEEVRRLAPEMDPLRLGMGWKLEDLEKPKVIIESTFGDSHPGSAHLLKFVDTGSRRRPGRALFHNGYLRRHGTGP